MIKVFRYPEALDATEEIQENLEYIGDYSNYEQDVFAELPVVPEDVKKALDKIISVDGNTPSNEFPMVVYMCETIEDINKMETASMGGGGFYNGEFSYYTDDYYLAFPEYGAGVIVVPIDFREELVRHINALEEAEVDTPDIATEIKVSSKVETSSRKSNCLFNKLYRK